MMRFKEIILLGVLLFALALPGRAAQTQRTVRVGVLEGGAASAEAPSDYTRDYLNEIAKYTGWRYEYVAGDDTQTLAGWLERGEIDVMGVVVDVSDEAFRRRFALPDYSCGASFCTLAVRMKDTRFSEGDHQALTQARVAASVQDAAALEKMAHFFQISGIAPTVTCYPSQERAQQAVRDGECDAVLGGDRIADGLRLVARFASAPYELAVAKGNREVLDGLNMAIEKIRRVDVDFESELYNKYFPPYVRDTFELTAQQQAFVASLPPLRVVSGMNNVPLDYFHGGDYRGITADVLEKIAGMTGLTFTYQRAETPAEAFAVMRAGEADLMTGLFDDEHFKPMEDITLCRPYLHLPYVIVRQEGLRVQDIGSTDMALVRGQELTGDVRNASTVHWCDTVEDTLRMVQRGEAMYCYVNTYSAEYYKRAFALNELTLMPLGGEHGRSLCFGVPAGTDPDLIEILNTAVSHLSSAEVQEMVRTNSFSLPYDHSALAFLRTHMVEVNIAILALLLCGVLAAAAVLRQRRASEDQALWRYRMLAELTGEVFFEYDFAHDRLTLSGSDAGQFGLPNVTDHFLRRLRAGELPLREDDEIIVCLYQARRGERKLHEPFEFPWLCPDKKIRWFQAVFDLVRDDRGRLVQYVGKLRSIDQERRERGRLMDLAQRDPLTGLYNKGASEALSREFLRREGRGGVHALLVIDVDNFKGINDTYGHACGDRALIFIADLLRAPFRADDIIGRAGGDEFMVFLKNLREEDMITEKALSILKGLENAPLIDGHALALSCSIGVAFYPRHGSSYDELFRSADAALYEMKKNGKRGVRVYTRAAPPA